MRLKRRQPRRRPLASGTAEDELIGVVRGCRLPRQPGSWRVAVMGPKGGSGKTPTAATLAMLLGQYRGELTALVDANTHMGTLRRRMVAEDEQQDLPEPMLDMADLALAGLLRPEWPALSRFCDLVDRVRVFSNAGVDPHRVENMTGNEYTAFLELLSRAAQLVVSDMGTSTVGEVAIAALDAADQLVVCTEMRRDALELVIEWMSALAGQPMSYRPDPEDYSSIADGRYAELVSRAVVVVAPGGGDPVELGPLLDWLATVTSNGGEDERAVPEGRVVIVPHDPHVATGGLLRLDGLQPATRLAYLQVAAHTTGNFKLPPLAWRQPPTAHRPATTGQAPAASRPAAPGPRTGRPPSAVPGRSAPAGQLELGGAWSPPPVHPIGRDDHATAPATARTRPDWQPAPHAPAVPPAAPSPPEPAPPPAPPALGIGAAANFALGREQDQVLGVTHTEGEACSGCADPDCTWPTVPPGGRS